MAFQHIFTSAQMGLNPGSSGYCTVAQSEDIPGDLVKALERLSTYDFSARNDPEMGGHSPVIYRYQVVQSHSGHYFVVSRISDAGADHTGRTNYLAQHLALDSSEILQLRADPRLNPAALLLIGLPWKKTWGEMPQTLPNLEVVELFPYEHPVYVELEGNGCSTWKNNPLRTSPDQAPTLLESPWNTKCFLHLPPGQERVLLKLLVETLWLSGEEAWRYGFTTFLQHEESHENYAWCAVSGGNAQEQASGQMLWEIQNLPQASDKDLKYKAATGQEEPIEPEPAPEPEVTQPQVPPAGPTLHIPSPDPTHQQRSQPQPTPVTSPPSIEDFTEKMKTIAYRRSTAKTPDKVNDDEETACKNAFRARNQNYAKHIKSQIQGSSDLKFIESEQDKLHARMAEILAKAKGLNEMRLTKSFLMDIRIKIYDSLDNEITAILKKGIKPPEDAPPPPPPPANGTPEKSHWKKVIAALPWKKVIVVFGLVVVGILVWANSDWINDKIKEIQAGGTGGSLAENNSGNQGGNNQGSNNQGGNNPDNEYKTSPELKAKVDDYFGTGNAIVRLFVAKDGQLDLTGNYVPELFAVLSKDQLNPKPTQGLPEFIEVYQPQSTSGFEGLKWEPADPNVLASSGVELLYGRSNSGNEGISITGVQKWPKRSASPGMNAALAEKVHKNAIIALRKKTFSVKVKKNTAIRVKTAGKTEIIYILNKPGIFFDGLFDEAVNKPKGSGSTKLVIDPYLMNRLNQHVLFIGVPTISNLGMEVPESVYKADNLPTMLVLNLKNRAGREWVAYTKDLDNYINEIRKPSYLPYPINVYPNSRTPTKRNSDEYLFQIGALFPGELFKEAKITVTPNDRIEVTGIRSGAGNNLKKEGNTFVLKNNTTKAALFYCWVKSKKPAYKVKPQENIAFKLEFSNLQKNALAKPNETKKGDRMKAFRETLKVDTTLGYYKPNFKGAFVIQFNRKK